MTSVFSQNDVYEINRVYTQAQLSEDFDILISALEQVHPSLNRFATPEKLALKKKEIIRSFENGLTESEFQVLVRQYIKEIRCGHTAALPSLDWYNIYKSDPSILPFTVFMIEDELYFRKNLSDNVDLPFGAKILSINGDQSTDIIQSMRNLQQVDGLTTSFEDFTIQKTFITYHLFLYGPQEVYQVEFINSRGDKESLSLSYKKSDNSKSTDAVAKSDEKLKMSGASFKIHDDNKQLGILDINSFNRKGFKKFHKSVFQEIQDQEIKHLVIDLRGNGGGYFPNGSNLLRYLLDDTYEMKFSRNTNKIKLSKQLKLGIFDKFTKQMFNLMPDKDKTDPMRNHSIKYKPIKKNAFDGQVYVLIDGGSFSMSSLVSTQLKHRTKAIIIGSETGGAEFGSNAVLNYVLTMPNTQVRAIIPHYYLDHDVEPALEGRGVIPDYTIKYTLEERLANQDKELDQILQLINSSQ